MMNHRVLFFMLLTGLSLVSVQASGQTSVNLSGGEGGADSSVFVSPNKTSPTGLPSAGSAQAAAGSTGDTDIIAAVRAQSNLSDPGAEFYGLPLAQHQLYRGVIPGVRDTLPHIRRAQLAGLSGRRNRLTWIGYQRMDDRTRVFLQTFDVPIFEVVRGERPGELVIILRDTRMALSNHYRRIDARWIPRSIATVRGRRVGRDAHIVIQMRRQVEFSVSVDGKYLNIDFNDAFLETEVREAGPVGDPDDGNILNDPNGLQGPDA